MCEFTSKLHADVESLIAQLQELRDWLCNQLSMVKAETKELFENGAPLADLNMRRKRLLLFEEQLEDVEASLKKVRAATPRYAKDSD